MDNLHDVVCTGLQGTFASPFLPSFLDVPFLASACLALSCLPYLNLPHIALRFTSLPSDMSIDHRTLIHCTAPPTTATLQIYHLSRASALFKHERANNTVSVLATFFADLTTSAIGLLSVIPGSAVSYFMMGFPNEAYPFIMFVFWMVSTAEHDIVQCSVLYCSELYCIGVE